MDFPLLLFTLNLLLVSKRVLLLGQLHGHLEGLTLSMAVGLHLSGVFVNDRVVGDTLLDQERALLVIEFPEG